MKLYKPQKGEVKKCLSISYVSATAHQAGFSLSETVSAMGVLSNNGLEADKALVKLAA